MQAKLNRKGFSIVELLVVVAVISTITVCGWLAWRYVQRSKKIQSTTTHSSSTQQAKSSSGSGTAEATDPYAGWKTAVSPRGKFSVKYPANWSYAEVLGDKDNVEHITLNSANIQLTINSYQGKDSENGGQPNTTCPDCSQILDTESFTAGGLGMLNLDVISYNLDSGKGNALILEQPDGIYYIPSSEAQGVYTSFRAISNLPTLAAYQAESSQVFRANPDFATAKKIFQSISY